MKVASELTASFFDSSHAELGSTCHASIVRNGAVEFEESGTVEDLLDRLLVVVVKWPNPGLAETNTICEQGLFLTSTPHPEERADGIEELAKHLAT
jgi:hypothetical protein